MAQAADAAETSQAQVLAAYVAAKAALRAQVVAGVGTAWGALKSWRDTDIAGFADTVAPFVAAGQSQMASLTNGYLAASMAAAGAGTGMPTGVDPAAVTGSAVRTGVDPIDEYTRPGQTVWYQLSQGTPIEDAVAQGGRRAETLAATDLQLAATHAAQITLAKPPPPAPNGLRVVGYRRVVTNAKACQLCKDAATQRYHSDDLMPIHPNCDCTVEPIVGTKDPGRRIDLKTVAVHHHGELGPVLAVRGQHFTGPSESPVPTPA